MLSIDYTGRFGDYRLEKRGTHISGQMFSKNTAILHRSSTNRSDYVSNCNFFNCDKVDYKKIINPIIEQTAMAAGGKSVIIGSDTTEANYESHAHYLNRNDKDLGPVGNNKDLGFFMHPSIVLDEASEMLLGISDLHIWNRSYDKTNKHEREYKKRPIEEKESNRWITCAQNSKIALKDAATILFVADREADIYEAFATLPDERCDVLIRSKTDRQLYNTDVKLRETLKAQTAAGHISLIIRDGHKRAGRKANLSVKHTKVLIARPARFPLSSETPEYVELYAIEVKEPSDSLAEGEKSIHWILLTSRKINSLSDALYAAKCYGLRWQIELVFGTLKSKGLDIEESQLESGKALKSMAAMSLIAAVRINQLRTGRENTTVPCSIVFTATQISLLHVLCKKFEGQTEKQKNPYPPEALAWGTWVIARLGGWKGYTKNESPPGNKTMLWGWNQFLNIFEGWQIASQIKI